MRKLDDKNLQSVVEEVKEEKKNN